jgi:MoxR-like ATPase
MQVSEVLGHPWPNGDKWEWRDGPATLAYRHGRRLVLNELSRCNPELLDCMLALTDNVESSRLTLPTGEVLRPTPGFLCIATANADPAQSLDIALQRRLILLQVTTPHPKLIERIKSGWSYDDRKIEGSEKLAALVARSYEGDSDGPIDCRQALRFLELKGSFDLDTAGQLCFGARGRDIAAMLPLADWKVAE